MSYIKFENIHKNFGENYVLKGIDLNIEKGELVTLLGPSGCGKSTLLRCLAGLESVSEGRIYLDGRDITSESPKQRQIGMVFQQYSLFPNLNVRQNVSFGLQIKKMQKDLINKKVNEVLELVGLLEKKEQYPNSLSGGQMQRVALARAIVMEPKVLLLDEPLSAIDALLRRNLQTEIRRIQRQLEITTVFVTHDQEEAMVMSDTIHLFHDGHIEQSGTPEEIYTRPSTYFAANFIGRYNVISAKDFSSIAAYKTDHEWIAIRPESIRIDQKEEPDSNTMIFSGDVVEAVVHGNIIAYKVRVGNSVLKVDRLFDKDRHIHVGMNVKLFLKKADIVELR